MVKFFSILFNLIYAVTFGGITFVCYSNMMAEHGGFRIFPVILMCFTAYFAIDSFITIFKKLTALSKGSVIKGAFAIKRDIPMLAITIAIAANSISDNLWSVNTLIYVVLSVIGIIGVICTASVAKKFF